MYNKEKLNPLLSLNISFTKELKKSFKILLGNLQEYTQYFPNYNESTFSLVNFFLLNTFSLINTPLCFHTNFDKTPPTENNQNKTGNVRIT
jgi:hypothetical protein